jgi:glycosyltransferase involved in cell wall biosynthesis
MSLKHKKRLAFIDHSFHKLTRSSAFFRDVLSREYEVTELFDDRWRGGRKLDLQAVNAGSFDVVLFWQVLPAAREILRLKCPNLVWVPMYDNEWNRTNLGWRVLRRLDLKVICFCESLYQVTQRFGIHSMLVRYFPEVPEQSATYENIRVFLWQRVNEIGWPLLKKLLPGNDIENIILKDDPDPNHLFAEPEPEELAKFKIEIVRDVKLGGGNSAAEYARLLSRCNVFVAPRLREGIGLSFLDAMARGMCVLAADEPTMNEYICSGENGLLFAPDRPSPADLSNFAKLGMCARRFIENGRANWQASLPTILHFIHEPTHGRRSRWMTLLYLFWDFVTAKLSANAAALPAKTVE